MDSLERFVKENRKNLDRYEPSDRVWEQIEGQKILISRKLIISVSAAAILFVVISSAMLLYTSAQRKTRMSGIPGELREMEYFYNSMASTLYLKAKPMLTGHPEIEKELENDLQRIDKICIEIKRDLNDNVDNQEVIEALIQNYIIKIHILEDMLRILNENEDNTEKQKDNEL